MAPRVSIITRVHEPEAEHLAGCLASVVRQTYADFEHIVVDDGSTQPHVAALLTAFATADPRVKVSTRDSTGGVVAAGNDALAAATGEMVAFLGQDDVLEHDALESMVAALDEHDAEVAYSDHDEIRADGRHVTPWFKPDFSPERLRSQNYISSFLIARRTLVDDAGGFRDGFDGAEDHDLVLRLTERAERIAHVPSALYHRRQTPSHASAASGALAVASQCERLGIDASVEPTDHDGCYRVVRRVTERPLVSVVIPTRGSSGRVWGMTRCFVVDAVRSLIETSTYRELEFVVVYDAETPPAVLHALRRVAGESLVLVPYDAPFNFSEKMNLGVSRASGDLLLLLNDDTELIEPASVEVLVGHLQTPGVAMVGAKLLFADGTLQHGGHLYDEAIHHACFGWGGDSPGPLPLQPLAVERECSGVTAAAALVRRDAFEEVGGFATELPLSYNDVDLCLKLRHEGHRIVWTPWAVWYHFESRTRHSEVRDEEYTFINERWHYEINNDPYYNINLLPGRLDWLERPFRSGAPPIETRPALPARLVARLRSS